MVIKQRSSPNAISPEAPLTQQLSDYAANRHYQDVIELLRQTEHHNSVSQNVLITCLVQVTQQLCCAALQTQDDIEHNKESLKASELRQIEFDKEIQSVVETLDLLLTYERSVSWPTAIAKSSNSHHAKTTSPIGRWNSIVNFLMGKMSDDLQTVLATVEPLHQADYRLEVYTLGTFQVYHNEVLVENWSSRKGTHIFKYLLLNREHPIHKEVLMEQFWPESDAESQRNNLNVAVYGLRQNLRDVDSEFSHVLFQNDCYFLNPELDVWVDADAFKSHYEAAQSLELQGKVAGAMAEYAAAETLYDGCFLPEDLYEDWTDIVRQELQLAYLNTLNYLSRHYLDTNEYAACASMCQKILAVETCSEEAHARLMCCYRRQGQVHLALRQYDRYVKILETELDMAPSAEIKALHDHIRAGEAI